MSEIINWERVPEIFRTLDPLVIKLAMDISTYRTPVSRSFILRHCEILDIPEEEWDKITDILLQSELIESTESTYMIIAVYRPFLDYLLRNMIDEEQENLN